jgi:hypothetical protein
MISRTADLSFTMKSAMFGLEITRSIDIFTDGPALSVVLQDSCENPRGDLMMSNLFFEEVYPLSVETSMISVDFGVFSLNLLFSNAGLFDIKIGWINDEIGGACVSHDYAGYNDAMVIAYPSNKLKLNFSKN